jgi:6-phosphogluconolactonase (cycloisomerase 2 family)
MDTRSTPARTARLRRSPAALALATLTVIAGLFASPSVPSAKAVSVYGPLQALSEGGGCLHDPTFEPSVLAACPASATGLTGADALAFSADGASVYVAGEDSVVALARDRVTGALRPALTPSARACVSGEARAGCAVSDAALSGADAIATSPDGRFVYVGALNSASVLALALSPAGRLVPLSRRTGAFFGCVAGEPIDTDVRAPCAARVDALHGVTALAISPDGRYVYAVSGGLGAGEDSIVTLERDPASGGLRPLAGQGGCVESLPGRGCRALPGLEGASAIVISPDGRFVYVASQLSGAVRAFARDRRTGALTPLYGRGGCISSGGQLAFGDAPCGVHASALAGARSLALSPDGRELYVAAFAPGAVAVLDRNPASGRLAPTVGGCLEALPDAACPSGAPFLRGAAAVSVAASGRAVYVASEGANSLVELSRDPGDGALTLAAGGPTTVDTLNAPAALALSPGGQDVYIASPFDDGVAGFTTG